MDQEQMMQVQMMEQESNQLNQHLEIISQNLNEMEELKRSLEEIEKSDNNEILANLGKRIYIPVEIKEKKLIVEVGNKTYVKKSVKDTIDLIKTQIQKLNLAKDKISMDIEGLQDRFNVLIEEFEKEQRANTGHKCKKGKDNCECGHSHDKDHECECDDCEDEE